MLLSPEFIKTSWRLLDMTSSRYDVHTWSLCIKISLKLIFMSSFSPCCLTVNSIFFASRFEVDGTLPSRWIEIQGGSCEFLIYKLVKNCLLDFGTLALVQHYSQICQWCSLCHYSNAVESKLELILKFAIHFSRFDSGGHRLSDL